MRMAAVQLEAVTGDVAANLERCERLADAAAAAGAEWIVLWHYQREHGRRWYVRHTRGLPPLEVPGSSLERRVEL